MFMKGQLVKQTRKKQMNQEGATYYCLEQLLWKMRCSKEFHNGKNVNYEKRRRYWTKRWQDHIRENGKVPMILE